MTKISVVVTVPGLSKAQWDEAGIVHLMLIESANSKLVRIGAQRLKTAYGWLHCELLRLRKVAAALGVEQGINNRTDMAVSDLLFKELLDWPDDRVVTKDPEFLVEQFSWAIDEIPRLARLLSRDNDATPWSRD